MDKRAERNELQIVFIYDRLSCQKEEDDPKDAILYFHPKEIAEEKRIAICGQLMGITHFLHDTFSSPRIITLENGKFALRNFGRQYVLALGCSSVTPDWLLEKQADILESLTRFFHCDIHTILERANWDRDLLSVKLTAMMDHYIPISQHHGDLFALTFGILPILYLPKSANNISLQASVILQTCMMKTGVLGGIVMYQNKVVGVELGQNLAQKLAFIQPYRMPPADVVQVNFKLPIGVQIFSVFVTQAEFNELLHSGTKFQRPSQQRPSSAANKDGSKIRSIREEDSELRPRTQTHSSGPASLASDVQSHSESSNYSSLPGSNKEPDNSSPSNLVNGFIRPKPRRCQSAIDLRVSDFEELTLKSNFGKSIADPLYPFVRDNGRSVSHSIVNTAADYGGRPCHLTEELEVSLGCSHVDESPPIASTPKKPQAPADQRRPMDLQLGASPSASSPSKRRVKKKLWSTFDDMMSPIEPVEPQSAFITVDSGLGEGSKLRPTSRDSMNGPIPPYSVADSSSHSRLLTSFRKLSSQDDDSSLYFSSSSGSEKRTTTTTTPGSAARGPTVPETTVPPLLAHPKASPVKLGKLQRKKRSSWRETPQEIYQRAALYIYYDGSMRLLLILDPEHAADSELINSLWEYGSSSVIQLKNAVSNVEEQSVFSNQSDPYCFLRYESVWKSLAHGGRDESMDFNAVQLMHRDFTTFPNISELIIRGDDHVVYGYQCVGSEVYYQQRAGLQPGLPMVSDLMGKVPLKAKRRLERDHSIILL